MQQNLTLTSGGLDAERKRIRGHIRNAYLAEPLTMCQGGIDNFKMIGDWFSVACIMEIAYSGCDCFSNPIGEPQ